MSEENQEKTEVYSFADCVLDADRRELKRAGDVVTLQPKAFELLLYLLRQRHRAVDKDELQDALWPRSIVTETALTRCVMKARRAIGDDADQQFAIKTVHGHGYRFVADIDEAVEPAPVAPLPEPAPPTAPANWKRLGIPLFATALLVAALGSYFLLTPQALGGPVRLAVLPVENATNRPELDWVGTGLMAMMDRMLQDDGIETVNSRTVTGLAGDEPITRLVATGSEFRDKLARTAAATHVLGARLEDRNGLYRITYTLAEAGERPTRRTMVGQEPTALAQDIVKTVAALIEKQASPKDSETSVSKDEFLNQAYARGMALYHEGRYQDAKELFEVIIEQEPHLFWPRYERALSMRQLRDYAGAERELIQLRREFPVEQFAKGHAGIENALGIIYMDRQRTDEARTAYQRAIELATNSEKPQRAAASYINLGLLERNVGNIELALQHMQRAETIYRDMDIEVLPGVLHNNLSGILIQMGQFEEAMSHSKQAVSNFQFTGERRFESYALSRLADIHTNLRNYDEAIALTEQALAVRQELNDKFGVASSQIDLADIAAQRGDLTRAQRLALQAYESGLAMDDHRIIAAALVRIARAELRLGNPQAAAARYDALESMARVANDAHNVLRARRGKAETLIARARYDEAMAIGNALLDEARGLGRQRDETAALRIVAGVHAAQDRHNEAIEVLTETYSIAESINDSVVQASLHILLAESWLALRQPAAAENHVQAAALARPDDLNSLKVQADYAAQSGDVTAAIDLMTRARTSAGESWSESDNAILQGYRDRASEQQGDAP